MTSFLCIQAIAELTHSRAFLGANVCRVLDIRLTEPAQRARGDDLFIPGYSPNSSWDAMSNNLPAWAQRHASHVGTTSHGGRLVIAYHVWEECGDKKLPFRSGLDAQRFLDILNLDRKFLWALARKTPMPLSKEQAASNLRFSFQTPYFTETTLSCTGSYDPATSTTFAFVACCRGEMEFFMEHVRKLAHFCDSPLLLPTVFYWTMSALLAVRLEKVQRKLTDVEIHNGKLKHIHRGQEASRDHNADQAHVDLVEQHFELTRGLAEFVEDVESSLCRYSHFVAYRFGRHQTDRPGSSRSTAIGSVASMSVSEDNPEHLAVLDPDVSTSHSELNVIVRLLHYGVRSDLRKRRRFLDRIPVQINVLYNFKQTRIAEASYIDAAALKTLTVLATVLLPPTALATVFGANNFFTVSDGNVVGVTTTFSAIFLPVSIIVVLLVIGTLATYTHWYDIRARLSSAFDMKEAYKRVGQVRNKHENEQVESGYSFPIISFPISPKMSYSGSKYSQRR